MFDQHKNLAYSTIAVAPSPGLSGTTATLQTGDGAKFPAVPFNVLIWPAGTGIPLTTNAEIARVTAMSGDAITAMTRATATEPNVVGPRTVVVGDQIAVPMSGKLLTDIESVLAAGTTGQVLTSTGAGNIPTFQAPPASSGAMTLLKAGSGTDTHTAATLLDTYALASQLTVKDTLLVIAEIEQVTQNASATMQIINSTDSIDIDDIFEGGTFLSTYVGMGRWFIAPLQSSSKAIALIGQALIFNVGTKNEGNTSTFTTDWTGAWTIALKSGGQTAGGTIKWKWSVYKLAGQ